MGHTTGDELLFSSGVLTAADGRVSLSAQFESTIDDYRATITDLPRSELSRLIREKVDAEPVVDSLVELAALDPGVGAELCALSDHVEVTTNDWLPLLPVLRLFRNEAAPTDGVPDGFVPVPGEHVPHLADIYSRVLVYIWLDDCPPCDVLKRRLESIFDHRAGVLLFAVYGPAHREFLAQAYDVTAGPALLFMRDGTVDTRLYGAHGAGVIDTELERLQQ